MHHFYFAIFTAAVAVQGKNLTVQTSLGPIIGAAGETEADCASFYGVPYAAAPIGENRFRPPQPASQWTTPKAAFHVGDSCLQPFADGLIDLPPAIEYILETLHFGMEPASEDCLFLNIFTPFKFNGQDQGDNESLPVMVWFHGGSNIGGSGDLQSNIPFYDGKNLCATGPPAVIVTVNYRLGVFGFFAHDELLNEEGTAGNMGFQDQRMALRWVQDNARYFGGDPNRVTIFGESAGAADTAVHLSTSRSSKLFSAGIMQSGGLWVQSFDESKAKSQRVIDKTSCNHTNSTEALSCMRQLTAHSLLKSQQLAGWGGINPCADGYEYPFNVTERRLIQSGDFDAKPMIVGTNLNESALFDCGTKAANDVTDEASFRSTVSARLGFDANSSQIYELKSLYDAELYYGNSWQRAFIDLNTDLSFFCDSRSILDAVTSKGQPAFQYRLDHTPLILDIDPCWGVPHMSDLFMLFGNFDAILTDAGRKLGMRMRLYWKSFAENHTAGPGGDWPSFGGSHRRDFLVLSTPEDHISSQWKEKQCDFIDQIFN